MKSETIEVVIRFVAEETGVEPSRITAATRLGEDLGVDGDDATDLMAAFASRFSVDLGEFDHSLHFGPEAGWSPFSVFRVFTDQEDLQPVTVGQMAEAAEKGVWRAVGD